MGKEVSFKLDDHSADILQSFENCEDEFLEALGIQGATNVALSITKSGHVYTGLMRNSVTYAVSGAAAGKASYNADSGGGSGAYSGTAPAAASGDKAVYVGSNVEYFLYQNDGYHRPDGTFVPGIHALEDGMMQLQGQAEEIARKVFKSVTGG